LRGANFLPVFKKNKFVEEELQSSNKNLKPPINNFFQKQKHNPLKPDQSTARFSQTVCVAPVNLQSTRNPQRTRD
jgi:hypothetical protein